MADDSPAKTTTGAEDVDLLARESLARAWGRRIQEIPDREFLREVETGRCLTYGELGIHSEVIAQRFARAGLARGDRIVFSAGPRVTSSSPMLPPCDWGWSWSRWTRH